MECYSFLSMQSRQILFIAAYKLLRNCFSLKFIHSMGTIIGINGSIYNFFELGPHILSWPNMWLQWSIQISQNSSDWGCNIWFWLRSGLSPKVILRAQTMEQFPCLRALTSVPHIRSLHTSSKRSYISPKMFLVGFVKSLHHRLICSHQDLWQELGKTH